MNTIVEKILDECGNKAKDTFADACEKYGMAKCLSLTLALVSFAALIVIAYKGMFARYILALNTPVNIVDHDKKVLGLRCLSFVIMVLVCIVEELLATKDDTCHYSSVYARTLLSIASIFGRIDGDCCNPIGLHDTIFTVGIMTITLIACHVLQYRNMKHPLYDEETWNDKQENNNFLITKLQERWKDGDMCLDGCDGRESRTFWETANFVEEVGRNNVYEYIHKIMSAENLVKAKDGLTVFVDKSGKLSEGLHGQLRCEIRPIHNMSGGLLVSIYPKKKRFWNQ